jgi:(2Fe-2S) ferredoxin
MVQINDYYYENLDVELLDRIIDAHATKGSEAAAVEFSSFASFGAPHRNLGGSVTSAPPPPSEEAIRLASRPPPPSPAGTGEES